MSDSLMTPQWVYDALVMEFGHPLLDPCWHPASPVRPAYCYMEPAGAIPEVYPAVRVLGLDGLEESWLGADGWVYVNPPYSNVTPWLEKAWESCLPVRMLLKFDPTTRWFNDWVRTKVDHCGVFRKRLKYGRTDGGSQHSAEFPSCMVAYNCALPRSLPLDKLTFRW